MDANPRMQGWQHTTDIPTTPRKIQPKLGKAAKKIQFDKFMESLEQLPQERYQPRRKAREEWQRDQGDRLMALMAFHG